VLPNNADPLDYKSAEENRRVAEIEERWALFYVIVV